MNKRFCYMLLIFLMCFIYINRVFAFEFSLSTVVSQNEIIKGEKGSIILKLTSDEVITSCEFKIESDAGIVYENISSAMGWQPKGSLDDGFVVTNSDWSNDTPNNIGIGQLNFVVNDSGNVVIKSIKCTSSEDNLYTYADLFVSFSAIDLTEEDTTLKSITVTNGVMEPANIMGADINYNINLASSTFGLSIVANNDSFNDDIVVRNSDGQVISDLNNISFSNKNDNIMPLTVTVNGKTTYSLFVTYVQKELDNSLASLTINGDSVLLQDSACLNNVCNYKYMVSKDVTEFIVAAMIKDNENFTFGTASNAPGTFTIKDYEYVHIEIVPKDSSIGAKSRTYVIEVMREGYNKEEEEEVPEEEQKPTGSSGTGTGNVNNNVQTSDVPMMLMAFILVTSLLSSIVLYRKNLAGYK